LKNFIAVTFPTAGLTYELPLGQLAGSLADAMAKAHPEWRAEYVATQVATAFDDATKLGELARHMLTWPDMRGCARLVECVHVDEPAIEGAVWSEGYDEARSASLPDAANQGRVPLDLHLSVMWQLGAKVSAQVFNDAAGNPTGAMIFVGGNKEQIDAYLSVCAQLCTQMTEQPEGAPPPVRKPFKH
jgi:hypothetical protein